MSARLQSALEQMRTAAVQAPPGTYKFMSDFAYRGHSGPFSYAEFVDNYGAEAAEEWKAAGTYDAAECYRAVFDYCTDDAEVNLSLTTGQLYTVLDASDLQWWHGAALSAPQTTGFFPASYLVPTLATRPAWRIFRSIYGSNDCCVFGLDSDSQPWLDENSAVATAPPTHGALRYIVDTNRACNTLDQVLRSGGIVRQHDPDGPWRISWSIKHDLHMLSPFQRVNRFPGSMELGSKQKFAENMERQWREVRGTDSPRFTPETFVLPNQVAELRWRISPCNSEQQPHHSNVPPGL